MEDLSADQIENELKSVHRSIEENNKELTTKRDEFASKIVNTISFDELLSTKYYNNPVVYKKPLKERIKKFFQRVKEVFFSKQ